MNYKGVCQKCGQEYWGLYLKFLPETKCVCGGELKIKEIGETNADNNKKH